MNGECYCGAPNCIGTLFPRIIRDEESSDDGENEAGEGDKDDDAKGKGGGTGGGDGMDMIT